MHDIWRYKLEEAKKVFEELVNENLHSDNLLTRKFLRPYYNLLNKKKNKLKFYKYCNAKYYAIRNIEKNTLAFKKCSEFNDPFEGTTLAFNEEDKEYLNIIRDSAVITCVSENKNDLLMFAHYADSYKGFCMEYDLNLLDKDIYERITPFLFPVIYSHAPEVLKFKDKLGEDIKNHIKAMEEDKLSLAKLDDIMSYFFHKANVWEYENEWRFIVPRDQYRNVFGIDDNIDRNVILFKDFDCLSSIYLGLKMPSDKREHISEIVCRLNAKRTTKRKIKLFDISLNEKEYRLDETEVIL